MATDAERARSFGSVADQYDRGRPGYPRTAIDWLLGSDPLDVVDLGAGTGKLTAALVAAGHRVVAVEPLEEMSAHLRTRLPGVKVLTASAEETGLPDHSVDAAVAGAAFHWFDRTRAFPEIARILRPPGILGLLSNRFDRSVAWVDSFVSVAGSQEHSQPSRWPDAAELGAWFTGVGDDEFAHDHPVDRTRLRDLAGSRSRVATMTADDRDALLAAVDGLWESEAQLRGHDVAQLRYLTHVRRATGLR